MESVTIICSGPAGYAAAIHAARANLGPLQYIGQARSNTDLPGGQLMLTSDIENYPGFPDGVRGPDSMGRFRTQAERFGTRVVEEHVTRVEFDA